MIFKDKVLSVFPPKFKNKSRRSSFTTPIHYITPKQYNKARKRNKRHRFENENCNCMYSQTMIVYIKNFKEFTKSKQKIF